jgi:hypothetical protein
MIKKSNYDGSTDGKSGNPFEVDKDLDSTWMIYSQFEIFLEAVKAKGNKKEET